MSVENLKCSINLLSSITIKVESKYKLTTQLHYAI